MKKCGHEYHSKCIDEWLKSEKRCPMCNEDVLWLANLNLLFFKFKLLLIEINK